MNLLPLLRNPLKFSLYNSSNLYKSLNTINPSMADLLCFFLLLLHSSLSSSTPLVFPLQNLKIPIPTQPKSPSKLLFHHNVTLVVPLTIGTPPQNITMVLDTGSELSWLQCQPSTNQSFFNPFKSTSYSSIPCSSPTCKTKTRDFPIPTSCDSKNLCHFSLSYVDASSSEGNLASETISVGESKIPNMVFGCVYSSFSSSSPDTPTTGIMGLNRGSLSFITQMGFPKFSYCIPDHLSSGVLLFGESNFTLVHPLNYTPLIQISLPLPYFDRIAYSVQLEGIRVAEKLLPLPKSVFEPDHTGAGQTMVDSGTQFTFLLGPVYTALKNEFMAQTKGVLRVLGDNNSGNSFVFQGALDLCFLHPPWKPLPEIPRVVLLFRGAEMVVEGEKLLYRVVGEEREGSWVYCFTFGNSDLVPVEMFIIGHQHQQNMWVEYDLQKARMGFGPARCDLAGERLARGLGF